MNLLEKAEIMDKASATEYLENSGSWDSFQNLTLQRALKELKENGSTSLTVEDLNIPGDVWSSMLMESISIANTEEGLDKFADPSGSKDRKDFWYKLLGHKCINLSPSSDDKYFNIALNESVMSIVNRYFQQYSWLMDFNIWLNLPSQKVKSSQMWHRDHLMDQDLNYLPGLFPLIKVFYFIEDVEDGKGEFWYLSGSQYGGKYAEIDPPKAIVEENLASRVADDVMLNHVSKEHWVKYTGKAGTVVMFDASGFHKGGHVVSGRRLILKAEYGGRQWLNPTYPKVTIKPEYEKRLTNPTHIWAFKYPQ